MKDFIATHTIDGVHVQQRPSQVAARLFVDKDGQKVKWNTSTEPVLLWEPLLFKAEVPPEEEPPVRVRPAKVALIHADAAMTILKATAFPEWANSHRTGQSCRGDDAVELLEKGPKGEKIVRISVRDPEGRHTHKVLVPKFIEFEEVE